MAAPSGENFDDWLSQKLQKLNEDVDLEAFVPYIRVILESEPTDEEKTEDLSDFLSQITEDDLEAHCSEVLKAWNQMEKQDEEEKEKEKKKDKQSLDERLANIMEKQSQMVVKATELSEEEKARKAAVLAQYGHVSEGDSTDEDEAGEEGAAAAVAAPSYIPADKVDLLIKNVNAQLVMQREQDTRLQSKADHGRKKQKDKDDREKQKQKSTDRKEAEKKRTQKGERRR